MKKKVIAMVMALALALCLFAGCSAKEEPSAGAPAGEQGSAAAETQEPEATDATGISITDMMGREVSLDAPADRIVVLTAGDAEILYAIGAGDTVVGRGEYCDYPAEILDVPAVESGSETNFEQVISCEPDLIVMDTMAQSQEQAEQFENAGIPVAVTDAKTIDDTYTAIEMLGALTGKEKEAATVIADMKSAFDELSANAQSEGEQKSIYFEVSPLEYGLWSAGTETFMQEVSDIIGLKNIFDDVSSFVEVSEEQVVERNPDYILTITMYFGEGPTPEESILARPGWENITAVKNAAILNLGNNELSRPSPRLVDGAKLLYELVYGESGK